MGLAASLEEIEPNSGVDPQSGLVRRTAYGRDVSVSHAVFPAGYRSVPNAYEGEELSLLLEGELSLYLNGQEYVLKAGDYIRIPPLAVHWKRNRSDKPAVQVELHNPPLGGPAGASLLDTFEREDASYGGSDPVRFGRTYIASSYYAEKEADFPRAAADDPLHLNGKPLWDAAQHFELDQVYCSTGTNRSIRVGSETMTILMSERLGLKARPHFHAAEQISYVLSGEIWTFFDDKVVYSKAGDFIRVPGNVVHWALVKPGEAVLTFEVHTPVQGDPVSARGIDWLLPKHRLPAIKWIPGGFSTDALPAEKLEEFENFLLSADAERHRLQAFVGTAALTPAGAQR